MRQSIEMGWSERTVTVNRLELLKTLRENKEKHQKEYQESVLGYKELAQEKLKEEAEKATRRIANNLEILFKRIEQFDPENPLDNDVVLLQGVHFSLQVPQDHSNAYEVAIQMAEWETKEEIELTQSQFQCFVMDEWDWMRDFKVLNARYSTVGKAR